MSVADLQAKMDSDKAFADKIKSCKTPEEIVAVAGEEGILVTPAEIAQSIASSAPFELSDEELESVSSGTFAALLLIK